MNKFYVFILILTMNIFTFNSTFAEDAYDKIMTGTTSIGVSLDSSANGVGNVYSPNIQYFFANNFFVNGGLRYAQGTITNGVSFDSKSYGVIVGLGGAVPLNKFVIFSLGADYSYYLYDLTYQGSSQPGSVDANGLGIGTNLELFVNSKSSLGLGIAYQSETGIFRDTGSSLESHEMLFTTGWKFYFN
jgi:outer membrane protein with beta-barrel domain